MSDDAIIRLSAVTKTYGQGQAAFQALKGIDLSIAAGDFVAVMGPSGSGKSTTMNILGCLDTPTGGSYKFQDVHVERLSQRQRTLLRRHFLGFVFQGFNLLARTTALENVELPLIYRHAPVTRRRAAARAALAQVGLEGWEHHSPAELSGGQQQRVAIARAIVSDPTLLVCDEPTGDLDRQSAVDVLTLLQQLNRDHGKTIIMVTHDPKAAEYARHTLQLDKGSLVEQTEQAPA
jgi:putative ABC transport system ATP-binding protein